MICADNTDEELDGIVQHLLEPEPCAVCDSTELVLLGILGNTAHFRCRACGIDTCRPVKTEKKNARKD